MCFSSCCTLDWGEKWIPITWMPLPVYLCTSCVFCFMKLLYFHWVHKNVWHLCFHFELFSLEPLKYLSVSCILHLTLNLTLSDTTIMTFAFSVFSLFFFCIYVKNIIAHSLILVFVSGMSFIHSLYWDLFHELPGKISLF